MLTTNLQKRLFENISQIEVIDSHEHLFSEKERLNKEVDVFTLFSHYTHGDLLRAGMTEDEYQSLFNRDIPLDKRWEIFAPYWKKIRWTSYSKAVLLATEKFYGFSDINDKTYEGISEAIKKANKPGLYENVLRKTSNIRRCLNLILTRDAQCIPSDLRTGLFSPVVPGEFDYENREALIHPPFEKDAHVKTMDDYLDAIGRYIMRAKSEGAVGLKIKSSPYGEPNRDEALLFFQKVMLDEKSSLPMSAQSPHFRSNPLRDYVIDRTIKLAGEQELVIAVHTGYWGDFRQLDPLHMIPIIIRYPKVRFDIYHLGYPWLRETLMLGKGFSNVWLNFCWTHIISQRATITALDEAIDLIPTNKILAFGGDYALPVEKVYGHLVMARENIAKVLAKRIEENQMNEKQALEIARKWFWENPNELYNLKLQL